MEVRNLPNLVLVLNYFKKYHKYDPSTREFVRLNEREVDNLSKQNPVLRLIEAKSTFLTGWKGALVLFSAPGLVGMNNFAKYNSATYYMPVWTLEELQENNALLEKKRKLTKEVLISRFNIYGGIPRFIFTADDDKNYKQLMNAIRSCNPLDMIEYVKQNAAV
jgi:hypothetical protein